jgi:hypothetical protein
MPARSYPSPLWGGWREAPGGVAHGVREKFRLLRRSPPDRPTAGQPKRELRSSRPHKKEG